MTVLDREVGIDHTDHPHHADHTHHTDHTRHTDHADHTDHTDHLSEACAIDRRLVRPLFFFRSLLEYICLGPITVPGMNSRLF